MDAPEVDLSDCHHLTDIRLSNFRLSNSLGQCPCRLNMRLRRLSSSLGWKASCRCFWDSFRSTRCNPTSVPNTAQNRKSRRFGLLGSSKKGRSTEWLTRAELARIFTQRGFEPYSIDLKTKLLAEFATTWEVVVMAWFRHDLLQYFNENLDSNNIT